LAQALRQVMGLPQATQGLLGKVDLFPLNGWFGMPGILPTLPAACRDAPACPSAKGNGAALHYQLSGFVR